MKGDAMPQEVMQPGVTPPASAPPPSNEDVTERIQHLSAGARAALLARCSRRWQPDFDLPITDPRRLACIGAIDAGVRALDLLASGDKDARRHAADALRFLDVAAAVCRDAEGGETRRKAVIDLCRWALGVASGVEGDAPGKLELIWKQLVLDPQARDALLHDLRTLQSPALATASYVDPSPSGPLGALWPDAKMEADRSLESVPCEEVLDDWRWIFQERPAGRFDEYRGQHVAVYRRQILGASRDMELLSQVLAEKHHLDPKRLVFTFIEP
jgi:hypothetical protein